MVRHRVVVRDPLEVHDMKTLAGWARTWGESTDALKSFVKRHPELKKLGTRIGPTRALSTKEANKIRRAFESRPAAKT